MEPIKAAYEAVIGLEVHAELNTESKIFCACPTTFGAEPNTQCCPVCLGLPGAMPRLNRRVVELAVRAGLALHCDIAEVCRMDRKHYFYPDLPKGYQISQNEHPICHDGYLDVTSEGEPRRIGVERIHIEEDAGKLMHGEVTRVDCNRCGVPLIEIVSRPELRSGVEAAAYLRELAGILSACEVSDCKLQEGSLRCDVNVSIRRVGETEHGERTEIKNINSFAFVQKAITYEIRRQIAELESTGRVLRRTMRYDAARGMTLPMRKKEQTADYRFLPEPDLLPFAVSRETVERIRSELPELPAAKRERLCRTYGIAPADAAVLAADRPLSDYYERAAAGCRYPILAVHLLLTDLVRFCKDEPFFCPVKSERLCELAELMGEGSINSSTAKKLLLRLTEADFSPRELAEREELLQITDPEKISAWVRETLQADPASVSDYRNGRTNAERALLGRVMALSGKRAEPRLAAELLRNALEEIIRQEGSSNV